MAKAIRIYQHGGPEVLRWEEVESGAPGERDCLRPRGLLASFGNASGILVP